MSLIPLLSTFLITLTLGILPRSDSIMILDNLKISSGGIWRQPYTRPIEGNETVQSGNNTIIMVRQIVKT
jgi:hypothetical protein